MYKFHNISIYKSNLLGSLTTQPDLDITWGAELSFSRGTLTFKLVLLDLLSKTGCLTETFGSIYTCLGCGILHLYGLISILFLINFLLVSVCIIWLLSLLSSVTPLLHWVLLLSGFSLYRTSCSLHKGFNSLALPLW